ncbi:MAG: class I SAM-dependent methyltransferase [Thermoplasmata archaeon]
MATARPRVHPAVWGFDRAAERYEHGRPDYPAAAIRHLGKVLRIGPGTTTVELGAGTGKFTRAWRPLGSAILAIEPIPGMRRQFARAVPTVPVLPGTAESIPLPDGFADAVVAAQAFHWFRPGPALAEIRRVLRPGGGVGLVWNRPHLDAGAAWLRALYRILDPVWNRSTPSDRRTAWKEYFASGRSGFGPLHETVVPHIQRMARDQLADRILSLSRVALLPPRRQAELARRIRELADTHPGLRDRPVIRYPYRTHVYWSYRRPDRSKRSGQIGR